MASIIRVKRSTGTAAPGTLQFGELGATLSGTGDVSNKGEFYISREAKYHG